MTKYHTKFSFKCIEDIWKMIFVENEKRGIEVKIGKKKVG